jgi:hypothetical protein
MRTGAYFMAGHENMLLSAQLREAIEKYPLHTQEFTPLTRKHGVQVDKQVSGM